MNKKLLASFLFGLGMSAAALFLAFRNVPFADLGNYLVSIDYIWVLPSVLVGLASFGVRALRWQIILGPVKGIGFWPAFHPMMIGFMLNCLLPGRVGEIARPAILQKNEKIPFATGLATVAAERVFDLGVLLLFLSVMLLNVRIDPEVQISFGSLALSGKTFHETGIRISRAGLALVFGLGLVSVEPVRKRFIWVLMKFPELFFFMRPGFQEGIRLKISAPLVRMVENFAYGLSLLRFPKRIGICIGLTVSIWGLGALSYYLMAFGCPGIGLSFFELSAVMIIICFFIALPSAPGFWGLWEAGGVFGLSLFGVAEKEAAGFTLANHAIQMFPVILIGILSAMILRVSLRSIMSGAFGKH
jgi:glycosyltransferase 2 family protein